MISRRDILVGTGCLIAAGSAHAMRPRRRISLMGNAKLDDVIPNSFAGWTRRETSGLVVPQDENSLAAKLYSQIVGRLYIRDNGDHVMMLIAYGDTQNDLLQLHRPETCYPAFGFQVSDSVPASFPIAGGVALPGRELTATIPERQEYISYWTRIGEYLPISGGEQRTMKLRTEIGGAVPDGVLVRLSNASADRTAAFSVNRRFAADFIAALPPRVRPALITTEKARQVEAALSRA